MSIENENQIDGARLNLEDSRVELHMMHPLEWNAETMTLLQNKVNTYLKFIESEEIYQGRDAWRGFNTVVVLHTLEEISTDGLDFISASRRVFETMGCELEIQKHQ